MDSDTKLEVIENLSHKTSKIYEEKAKSKLPTRNLEQNPLISSQSHPDLCQPAGLPVRSATASNLNTGTEELFSSPPRAYHKKVSSPRDPHGIIPHGELPSVVMDMESGTPSRSVNRGNKSEVRFVDQDNRSLSEQDSSDKKSSIGSKLKNFLKRKK